MSGLPLSDALYVCDGHVPEGPLYRNSAWCCLSNLEEQPCEGMAAAQPFSVVSARTRPLQSLETSDLQPPSQVPHGVPGAARGLWSGVGRAPGVFPSRGGRPRRGPPWEPAHRVSVNPRTGALTFVVSGPSRAVRGRSAAGAWTARSIKDEGHCAPSPPAACRALEDRSCWAPSPRVPGPGGSWGGGTMSRDMELSTACSARSAKNCYCHDKEPFST